MDFGELAGTFLVYFLFFMAIALIAFFISRAINKKKLGGFKKYVAEKLPNIKPEQEMLLAKQKSKQIKSDIALLIDEDTQEIILLRDVKGTGITHHAYGYANLKAVTSTNQIISRGIAPKTYSYEETLHLAFNDGSGYDLILENISNKHGSDSGATFVRNFFAPWREKLTKITG